MTGLITTHKPLFGSQFQGCIRYSKNEGLEERPHLLGNRPHNGHILQLPQGFLTSVQTSEQKSNSPMILVRFSLGNRRAGRIFDRP